MFKNPKKVQFGAKIIVFKNLELSRPAQSEKKNPKKFILAFHFNCKHISCRTIFQFYMHFAMPLTLNHKKSYTWGLVKDNKPSKSLFFDV